MQQREKPPLAFQLLFLGKHLGYLMERRLGNRGLNRTQAIVLTILGRHPGLKALDLSAPARVEPANITRTLQSLERLGMVERRPHPNDGRASLFYLTPIGGGLAGELEDELGRISADLSKAIDPVDLPHLECALEALRRAVSGQLLALHHQAPSSGAGPAPAPLISAERDETTMEQGTNPGNGAAGPLAGMVRPPLHRRTDE